METMMEIEDYRFEVKTEPGKFCLDLLKYFLTESSRS